MFQKPLANESCKNFGVFLFHAMRQTHPQLTGTIPEKKLKMVNNLMKGHEKKKKRKKADEKVQNETDPPNGPDTQCKNGHQFKYSLFTLKEPC